MAVWLGLLEDYVNRVDIGIILVYKLWSHGLWYVTVSKMLFKVKELLVSKKRSFSEPVREEYYSS